MRRALAMRAASFCLRRISRAARAARAARMIKANRRASRTAEGICGRIGARLYICHGVDGTAERMARKSVCRVLPGNSAAIDSTSSPSIDFTDSGRGCSGASPNCRLSRIGWSCAGVIGPIVMNRQDGRLVISTMLRSSATKVGRPASFQSLSSRLNSSLTTMTPSGPSGPSMRRDM